MKMLKRSVSIVLAIAMLISLLPTPLLLEASGESMTEDEQWTHIQSLIAEFADKNTWTTSDYTGAVRDVNPLTALLGNGNVGVTSNGNASTKSYMLSSTDFWSDNATWKSNKRSPQIITGGGVTVGAYDVETGSTLTTTDDTFSEYQDIARAEIKTIQYMGETKVQLNNWIYAEENIMVTEVTSKSDANQTMRVQNWGNGNNAEYLPREAGTSVLENGQKYVWATRKSNIIPDDGHEAVWMSEFAIASTLIGAEGIYSASDIGSIVFDLPAGETVYVVTAIQCAPYQETTAATGIYGLAVKNAAELLSTVQTENDINEIHEKHLEWWKNFYLLSWIDMGDTELNRIYYGNQYLFGCSTREGCEAPGLYSVWITNDTAKYMGDFHLNYNFQGPYYGSYSSNRMLEYSEPMFSTFLDYIDEGIKRASDPWHLEDCSVPWYYSTREDEDAFKNGFEDSILLPVGLFPYGPPLVESYHNQTGNALFCADQIITYYKYTMDYEWLTTKQKTASGSMYSPYDFLAKTANFYTYWVEKKGTRIDDEYIKDGGQFVPEEYTANYAKYPEYDEAMGDDYVYVLFDAAHEKSYEFNPGVVLGNLQYLTDLLAELGSATALSSGYTEERYQAWKDLSEHLVSPTVSAYVDEQSGLKMFGLSENRGYRDISATVELEWIHPAYQLGFNGNPEYLEYARNTITVMGEYGKGYTSVNATPKVYTQAARIGYDAETIIARMKEHCITDMAANNYINDGFHGWEKAGIIEALNTMMVMSDDGIIKAFPTWTSDDAEFHTIRMPGAFLVSSKLKNGEVQYIDITSEVGGELKMVIPWDIDIYDYELVNLTTGTTVSCAQARTENSKDYYLIAETEAGHNYRLRSDGITQADAPYAPIELTVEDFSSTQIDVSWRKNPRENGVVSYRVTVAGTQGNVVKTVTTDETNISVTELTPDTEYIVSVQALYSEGQVSVASDSVSITLPSSEDVSYETTISVENRIPEGNENLDLTELGTADWIQVDGTTTIRKNTGQIISDLSYTAKTGSWNGHFHTSTSWTDGDTTASRDATENLRYARGFYGPVEFTVPAEDQEQTLTLSLGAFGTSTVACNLEIWFESDEDNKVIQTFTNTDSQVTNAPCNGTDAHGTTVGARIFTVKFSSEKPDDTLVVRFYVSDTSKQGIIQAIALKGNSVLDLTLIEDAIENANSAMENVEVIDDKTADQIDRTIKFVTTAEMEALTDAIALAESEKESVTTEADVSSIADALNKAVDTFYNYIKTGTYVTVTGIGLNKTELCLYPSASETLVATITPMDATNKALTWKSSNEEVVVVDQAGKITAISEGVASIMVTTTDDEKIFGRCEISIMQPDVDITLDKTEITLSEGACSQLTAILDPQNVGEETITWTSVNDSVAIVDNSGKVTAISKGETIITATITDNGKTATCKVIVTEDNSTNKEVYEFIGRTLELGGKIGVNFYIPSNHTLSDDAYVEFELEDGEIQNVAIKDTTETKYGVKFTCWVPAKEMADTITATVYDDGEVKDTVETTVRDYAETIISEAESNTGYAAAKELVNAMLNYGAYAQKLFDYKLDNLANKNENVVDAVANVEESELAEFAQTKQGLDDFGSLYGASLVLKGGTKLRIFFAFEEGVVLDDLTFSIDGVQQEYTTSGDYYVVEIPDISACHLNKDYTVTVTAGDYTFDAVTSAMTYCYNALTSTDNTALHNVAKALYLYNIEANKYIAAANYEARIGETYFVTFEEALIAATNGTDATVINILKGIEVDSVISITPSKEITIQSEGNSVHTISTSNTTEDLFDVTGTLTLNNLNLQGGNRSLYINSGTVNTHGVTIDGADATVEHLIDNDGGIFNLNNTTIKNAQGTALYIRKNATTTVNNVVLDQVGNYGIYIQSGAKLSGEGLEINNVYKNSEISDTEGIAIKNNGTIIDLNHVTIGTDDAEVAGSGATISATFGELVNNAIVNDNSGASYSGSDLVVSNVPSHSAFYNEGTLILTDVTTNNTYHSILTKGNAWTTLRGTVSISNVAGMAIYTAGPEDAEFKNGVTLETGANLVINGVGSYAINNKGSFIASENTRITIQNVKGSRINGIQNSGVMALDDIEIDGVYITIPVSANYVGNAVYTTGSICLSGTLTIDNHYYTRGSGVNDSNYNGNGVCSNYGEITGTGSVEVNGTSGTTINDVTYQGTRIGVFTTYGTIDVYGVTTKNTNNVGVMLYRGNTFNASLVDVYGTVTQGIYVFHENTIDVTSMTIAKTTANGLWMYNSETTLPTVTIDKLTVKDIAHFGVNCRNAITSTNLTISELWYKDCASGPVNTTIQSGVTVQQQLSE